MNDRQSGEDASPLGPMTSGTGHEQDRNMNIVMLIIGIPLGILLMIWTLWITVTAFVGGQAPWFFVNFDGFNPIRGLIWLILVDPIVLTVAYWIFMLIMLPIGGLVALLSRDKN